jgi:hypothetical protein
MTSIELTAPVAYQGGKQHVANNLLTFINPSPDLPFWDVCCGSGAVTIALLRRKHPASSIRMVDAGFWGFFWKQVSTGNFSLERLSWWCNQIPSDRQTIRDFMCKLAATPPDEKETPYIFLILQAASFGGRPIQLVDGRWATHGFRNLWLPTPSSNRQSPVNPMMPMPNTLLERMRKICPAFVPGAC